MRGSGLLLHFHAGAGKPCPESQPSKFVNAYLPFTCISPINPDPEP